MKIYKGNCYNVVLFSVQYPDTYVFYLVKHVSTAERPNPFLSCVP